MPAPPVPLVSFALCLAVGGCAHPGPVAASAADPLLQPSSARLAGLSLAVAYSGYRDGQHPDRGAGAVEPTTPQLLEDLRLLTRDDNFGLIRLYDSGETSERVLGLIRAHSLPLKVMLGAWLQAEASNHAGCPWLTEPIPEAALANNRRANAAELERLIRLAKEFSDSVVAVNVGNEVLVSWTDHLVPLESMIAHLRRVGEAIEQPVTVADNYVAWIEHGPALAPVVDFAAVHTYPVWEGQDIEAAMPFTVANMRAVRSALPKMRLVIGEAGWASVASEFGARASQAKQKVYCDALTAWADGRNITTFVFEAFDENWKGNPDNPAGAEKHWGLFTSDRRPKLVMQSRYPDLAPAPPSL